MTNQKTGTQFALTFGLVSVRWQTEAFANRETAPPQVTLHLKIIGLRNDYGDAIVVLYPNEKLYDTTTQARAMTVAIKDGVASLTFRDLRPGAYAVGVFHYRSLNSPLAAARKSVTTAGNLNLSLTSSCGWEDIQLTEPADEKTIEIKAKYL